MAKTYRVFVPETRLDKFEGQEDHPFEETLIDGDTQEAFRAKILVSRSPNEGYDELLLQARGRFLSGTWYVKILEREGEEDEVTVFESKRLGQRRGYMLRSMMLESETELSDAKKKEIMTTELQRRWQRKQQLVADLLKKSEEA